MAVVNEVGVRTATNNSQQTTTNNQLPTIKTNSQQSRGHVDLFVRKKQNTNIAL